MSRGKDPQSGYKRVPMTLVLHLTHDVPEDWPDESIQFQIEENYCADNYIEEIHAELEAQPNSCHTCSRAEKHLGHIKVGELLVRAKS
jgi:hypothetical protein